MNSGYAGSVNNLDCIRRTRGMSACRNMFRKLGQENRQTAIRLINDNSLLFASLFILQPEIKDFNLYGELSERNRIALNICEKIADVKKPGGNSGNSLSLNDETVHMVLLWMFHTGAADDGLSNEFDQILDITASVLIKTHHENAILSSVADLIFRRNRKGAYIHDIVWIFFQARNAQSLQLIAGYLRSPVQKDVELARTLLNLREDIKLRNSSEKQKWYNEYISWLNENSPYLYFTGESFQLTNSPSACDVNLEAKYLGKNSSPRGPKPLTPLTEEEHICLNHFNEVQEEEKARLAEYSSKLHRENQPVWSQWMQYPVEEQLQIAKYGRRELI